MIAPFVDYFVMHRHFILLMNRYKSTMEKGFQDLMNKPKEEIATIHVKTSVDYVCPFCGKEIDPIKERYSIEWARIGSGRFKKKQYFHTKCAHRK